MSVAELKEKLIHQIEISDDINLLEDLGRIIDMEFNVEKIFQLNESQISAIADARIQIKNGETLNSEQADQEINEWLKK